MNFKVIIIIIVGAVASGLFEKHVFGELPKLWGASAGTWLYAAGMLTGMLIQMAMK